eukprot:766991-Hanusia_phi.AAC.5
MDCTPEEPTGYSNKNLLTSVPHSAYLDLHSIWLDSAADLCIAAATAAAASAAAASAAAASAAGSSAVHNEFIAIRRIQGWQKARYLQANYLAVPCLTSPLSKSNVKE